MRRHLIIDLNTEKALAPSRQGTDRGQGDTCQGPRDTELNAPVECQDVQEVRVLGLWRRRTEGQDREGDREQGQGDIKDQRNLNGEYSA